MKLTKEQQVSLKRKWTQDNQGMSYLKFRRSVGNMIGGDGCVIVHWCNMWLGIETDGYTHS